MQPSGPPFARYHTFGETETDLEFGVPVVAPAVGEGRIGSGELPDGAAWKVYYWLDPVQYHADHHSTQAT